MKKITGTIVALVLLSGMSCITYASNERMPIAEEISTEEMSAEEISAEEMPVEEMPTEEMPVEEMSAGEALDARTGGATEGVSLTKEEVQYAIEHELSEDETAWESKQPNVTISAREIVLHSFGDKKTAEISLVDQNGNKVDGVNWYCKMIYPEGFYSAEEMMEAGGLFTLSKDGAITVQQECSSDERVYIWGEYKGALYKSQLLILSVANSKKEIVNVRAKEIIKEQKFDQIPNDIDKILAVHDFLANYITFDYNYRGSNYLYGALVEGKAVCYGYAQSFSRLMHELNINCEVVKGRVGTAGHAWDIVELEDGWYYVDVTYDDQEAYGIRYRYFLIDQESLDETHTMTVDDTMKMGTKYQYYPYAGRGQVAYKQSDIDTVLRTQINNAEGSTAYIKVAAPEELRYQIRTELDQIAAGAVVKEDGTQNLPLGKGFYLQSYVVSGITSQQREETPSAVFEAAGIDSGVLKNVTAGMKYTINYTTEWKEISEEEAAKKEIVLTDLNENELIRIVKKGTAGKGDSIEQIIRISRNKVPDNLEGIDVSTAEGTDGRILNTDSSMEYQKEGEQDWKEVSGNSINGLKSGSYRIRRKAQGVKLASVAVTIEIGVKSDPGEPKPDHGENKPDPGENKPDPGENKPNPGDNKPDPGDNKPDPGETQESFTYKGKACEISVECLDLKRTGKPMNPKITVKRGSKKLRLNKDYTVSFSQGENTNYSYKTYIPQIGTILVGIEGKGDYQGKINTSFRVTEESLSGTKISFTKDKTQYYYKGGKAVEPQITIQTKQGKVLALNEDYTVSYSNNINKGKASAVITGIGRYCGSMKRTYRVTATPLTVEGIQTAPVADVTFDSKGVFPKVQIKDLRNQAYELSENQDYKVKYSNNKKVSDVNAKKKPTITITGKGNYCGKLKVYYNIVPETAIFY